MSDKSNRIDISGDSKTVSDEISKKLDNLGVDSETQREIKKVIESESKVETGSPQALTYDVESIPSEDVIASGNDLETSNVASSSIGNDSTNNSSIESNVGTGDNAAQNVEAAAAPGYGSNDTVPEEADAPVGGAPVAPNQSYDNSEDNPGEGLPKKNDPNNIDDEGKSGDSAGQDEPKDGPNALSNGEEGLPEKEGLEGDKAKNGEQADEEPKNGNANTTDPNLGKDGSNDEHPDAKGLENDSKPDSPDSNPNTQGRSPNSGNSQTPEKNNAAGTDVANRNLDHNKRMKAGKEAEDGGTKSSPNSSASKDKKDSSPKTEKVKDNTKTKGTAKGNSTNKISNALNAKDAMKHPFRTAANFLRDKLIAWLLANPPVLITLVVLILIFILILFMLATGGFDGGGNGNGQVGTRCNYELNGVLSTGTLNASGLQVELVNCDATEGNYTVLEVVDFEKYVLGVALAEIGPGASDEALKAQIVASRNFALTRNRGMCPSNPDNCFYGYNASTGKIRMRACENDQVYWDYEKTSYREDRGAISRYSPEVNSGTVWKNPLSEERKAQVLAIADEVKGVVLLDESGNVVKTPYNSTVSTYFSTLASEGKTYKEILEAQYGVSSYNNAECSYDGEIFYGDYVLSSEGNTILHQRLDTFLASRGSSLEEFGGLIANNVNKAGYGTRAGVVTAAVTLIGELGNKYGVKLPYYWSGGHYDGVVVGPLGYWGSTECHIFANNQHYNYCGFDCSGFVPWAIKNGGFNAYPLGSGTFYKLSGAEKVTLRREIAVLQPGDLLESSGHIVLVIGVDEEKKQYICAEASGNQYGVWFTRRSFKDDGYWGVKMDGYYNNPSNIRRS